jgi:hypothetical protein
MLLGGAEASATSAAAPDLGFIGIFAGIAVNKMREIIWMEEIT